MSSASWKRPFFTIWGGQAISLLTSSIVQYGIIFYLTARTGSAAVLSIAAIVGMLPMALLSPFIGSLVDRWNRKTIMIVADACIALATALIGLVALTGDLPIWLVMVVLLVRAVGSAFHQPCLQAVTPQIVPPEELGRCGGYTSTLQSISYIASPAIAAALYAVMPLGGMLLLDVIGAVFGIGTVAMVAIPRLPQQQGEKLHVVRDAIEGMRLLRKQRGVYYLVLICSLFSLAYVPTGSLFPLMCTSYFGGTEMHIGIVEMVFAAGMLVGGLVLGAWGGGKNKMATMLASLLTIGVTIIASGLLPRTAFPVFAALSFMIGFSGPFFSSLFMAMIQQKIPGEYLGRVLGVSSSLMALACPVGLALSGAFADLVGIHRWFIISGVLTLVCAVPCVLIREVREVDKPAI